MPDSIAPLILFDLDGTLLDSAHDLHAAMNKLLLQQRQPEIAFETFRPVVSKGARAMAKLSFPQHSDAERDALLPDFLALYAESLAQYSQLFEGVDAVLQHIEQSGARWGIVTNKPYYLAEPLLHKLGWQSRCVLLLGGDSLPRKKPDPDQLLHACAELGVAPEQCVYVGDDERDIQAARAAGMRSVAALWGYRPIDDDPALWQADALAESPLQLVSQALLHVHQ